LAQNELEKNIEEVQSQKRIIEEQNAKLDAFVYKASHDIKGPLKSVIGLTKTGSKLVTDPLSLEFFDHILKSTTKLDNLVGDLLKLTKAQQAQVQKSEVQVFQIIQDGLDSFQNLESFKEIKIDVDVEPKLIHCTDEQLLYSIVQNFIENGIKYRDVKKPIANLFIRGRKKEHRLELEFEDNGMGIDPIHQPKIFDMFYKINPESEGTGLGLHIVKVNIEKLGGKVSLESEPGKGTKFTILIDELK
jgi:signal transduction histidine kinase